MSPESGAKAWEIYEGLKALHKQVGLQLRETQAMPAKPATIIDRIIIRLYHWAVKGRLTTGPEEEQ